MRCPLAIFVTVAALARPAAAENTFQVNGIVLGPQLVTPISAVTIDIADTRFSAILHEPFLTRLRTAGIGSEHAHHVLRLTVDTRQSANVALGAAVLVQLQVMEPVRAWQGGTAVVEYPEFTVWQAHELLLLPPLSEAFAHEPPVTAAAERLLSAFLRAIKDATPWRATIVIPNDCPETGTRPGA